MGIFNTYSKSKKGMPDVYSYDVISNKLRNQIYHIWTDYISQPELEYWTYNLTKAVYKTICKEEGLKFLDIESAYGRDSEARQIENYFETLNDCDKILDAIHIMFYYMENVEAISCEHYGHLTLKYPISEAISDLNHRFRENGVGYEYINKKIIRIDSKLLHQEAIHPALILLTEKVYKNANDEYLKAHEHYKHGRNQECLNECLKSFESVMKIICNQNKWNYSPTDTSKPLINILLTNGFLPNYNESSLSALRQLLEGTIPTVRNKNSGHGAGSEKIVVPDHLANYMLYLTGSTIKLLVDTQTDRKK